MLVSLVNLLFGTRYSDLCYGYNAFWSRCLGHLTVDCDGFEVETLLNIRAAVGGLVVAEVPSMEQRRIHGESNLNAVRDGTRVLRTIVRERLRRRSTARMDERPGYLELPFPAEAEHRTGETAVANS